MDFLSLQKKWQEKWAADKVFQPVVDGRPKFFLTFPFPYVNGYSHLGHSYTNMRVDAFARYKRLRGFNVLFPQGWHATGSPIVLSAKRVKQKEPTILSILKEMGIPDEDIHKFEDPSYWITFFVPAYKKDYSAMGFSVDWSREFVTTSINPHFDKFVQWQFRALKEKGYVIKGKFPVVWDPVNKQAIGDHDRSVGEGETPQEFTLIKFPLGSEFVVVATLRPETMYGQTNLWVNPEIVYKRVAVNNETWIVSLPCVQKLTEQGYTVKVLADVPGSSLVGKTAHAPYVDRDILILPSSFPKADKGTGLVTSVPSDAPDDWMGLHDLQKDPALCVKYGLDHSKIMLIKPIAIIDTDIGDMPAVSICEQMKIANQKDRVKLEEAKKIVYKKGFYEGVMKKNCGPYAGLKVEKAKDLMKRELIKSGSASVMYELTGRVVSRGLIECMVKIVDDQWFIDYANPEWKKKTFKALSACKLYPEKVRGQFEFTIDWLREWACTREEGLGTRLPWDEKWLIESLSDSTVYLAYYTIVPYVTQMNAEELDDSVFDFIFYGKGKSKNELISSARKEFLYWYPCDFRNSGKDLVQNHLTFYLFTHTALFDLPHCPAGIGVNGHIMVDGEKMAKSKGNFLMIRACIAKWGADALRSTILNGGEGLDDANFESSLPDQMNKKLDTFLYLVTTYYGNGRSTVEDADVWLESKVNTLVLETTAAMDETLFRSSLQRIFFEYANVMSKYLTKVDSPHAKIFSHALEMQAIMMSPFTPHTAEEAWSLMGKNGFVSLASWPTADTRKIDEKAESLQDFMDDSIASVESLRMRLNKKLTSITLSVAIPWKYEFAKLMIAQLAKTYNVRDILEYFKTVPSLSAHLPEIMTEVPKIIKRPAKLPAYFLEREVELKALEKIKLKLEEKYDCEILIEDNGETAEKAFPGTIGVKI